MLFLQMVMEYMMYGNWEKYAGFLIKSPLLYIIAGEDWFFESDQFLYWDGKNPKGKPVPFGTYYYIMNLDGYSTHGYVTILR